MNFYELLTLLQTGDETDRIEAKSAQQGIGKSFLETASIHLCANEEITCSGVTVISGELAHHTMTIPGELKRKIEQLKARSNRKLIREIIRELCQLKPMTFSEIAAYLGRHPKYLKDNYLTEMIRSKELEYLFEDPTHPQQAYKTKQS